MMNLIPLSISIEQALLVLVALLGFMGMVRRYAPNRWVTILVRIWIFMTAFAAWKGDLHDFDSQPPKFIWFFVPQLIAILYYLYVSQAGKPLIRTPQWFLIGFQAFRIPVELILAQLAAQNLFPEELTFRGINFDILSGILGLVLGVALYKKGESGMRKAMIAYNVVGLALLLNIIVHVAGSLPAPWRTFPYDSSIVTMFPMQWLPFFLAPLALVLHLISLKKIFSLSASSPA